MKSELNVRLRNSWKLVGEDRWDWSVFLEDDGTGDLDTVESVIYMLHPTFPNPRRVKKNKDEKFRLTTNGWGVFWIKAIVKTIDGKKIKLDHYLVLKFDPEEGETE